MPSSLIVLPKSGGSVSGLGEAFVPDPQTGTEGISVPLPLSKGRDGFGPQLNLCYSVANGNGVMGIGWKIDQPEITRRTQGGLPRYGDEDVFLLDGAELRPSGLPVSRGLYVVHTYRLRHEGSFSLIERWVSATDSFWRVTSKDNVTQVFGASAEARVADPQSPARVFGWQLELVSDGKGNVVHYVYKREDEAAAPAEERGRKVAQAYLKRLRYGNLTPLAVNDPTEALRFLQYGLGRAAFFFEAVFDYGEHGDTDAGDCVVGEDIYDERRPWDWRPDAFSSFRSGFEVRTRRSCRRVLMFHRVPDSARPMLVGSLDLRLQRPSPQGSQTVTLLKGVTRRGYARSSSDQWNYSEDYQAGRGLGVRSRSHHICSIPALEFDYSEFKGATRDDRVALQGLGVEPRGGLSDNRALVDLFQRGLPDILETAGSGFLFWKNLGGGCFAGRAALGPAPRGAELGADVLLSREVVGFSEISGDGFPDLLLDERVPGYCLGELRPAAAGGPRWRDYQPFARPLSVALTDASVRLLDLTGDGALDILHSRRECFEVFEGRGTRGFEKVREVPRRPLDEFPDLDLDDARVHLADMTGDGLLDIVLIDAQYKQIHYWPNLGFGQFGARITMRNSPRVVFDVDRLYLADIDGSGPADLIYVSADRVEFWLNHAGNEWSERFIVAGTPGLSNGPPQLVDLLGTGMTGLLWTGGADLGAWTYLPLSREKPLLLTCARNGMGQRVCYEYQPSTLFALESERDGAPWTRQLPFPVFVLSRVERHDEIANSKLVSTFRYAHGFYDSKERAFRGFGRVEQEDTERFSATAAYPAGDETIPEDLHQPPVLTRSWFHTGDYVPGSVVVHDSHEYYSGDLQAPPLPDRPLADGSSEAVAREACRALAGRLVRQEVYVRDRRPRPRPFSVSERRFVIRQLSGGADAKRAAFHVYEDQRLDLLYERDPGNPLGRPDPYATHELVLDVDALGHVTESVSVGYPRRPFAAPRSGEQREPEQDRALATYTKRTYCAPLADPPKGARHGTLCEERTFELHGLAASSAVPLSPAKLLEQLSRVQWLAYEDTPQQPGLCARLVAHTRYLFQDDDGASVLPLGRTGLRALPHNRYALAFSPGLLGKVYGSRVDRGLAHEGGYHVDEEDGGWWVPSGDPTAGERTFDTRHFCLPVAWNDSFGRTSHVRYDPLWLAISEVSDAVDNVTKADLDYRVLLPRAIEEANENRTLYAFDALGRVVGTAVCGKATEHLGDTLLGFEPDLDPRVMAAYAEDPLRNARAALAGATTRTIYDLWRPNGAAQVPSRPDSPRPAAVCTLAREAHSSDTKGDAYPRVQYTFVYSDGNGRELQTKTLAAPGPVTAPVRRGLARSGTRWVGSGATVYDNKGNPIKKYEPFFSRTHRFESESVLTKSGVAALLRYDPLGRLVRTDFPDGAVTRTEFRPWRQEVWDENDTISEHGWYQKQMQSGDAASQRAAQLASRHANTPTIIHADGRQRPFLSVADNGPLGRYATRTDLDIQGSVKAVTDARGHRSSTSELDMLKRVLVMRSIDDGERTVLPNVENNPMRGWDGVGNETRRFYDRLQRPAKVFVRSLGAPERLVERNIYGEAVPGAKDRNLRGQAYRQYDEAGVVTNEGFDFKGNVHRCRRQYWRSGHQLRDSPEDPGGNGSDPALEDDGLACRREYDALNRVVALGYGGGEAVAYSYDDGGHTTAVLVRPGPQGDFESHVTSAEYNARGQRQSIVRGEGLRTDYTYDPLTFRLRRLVTRRADRTALQDLAYTYDAAGNVLEVRDAAQPRVHFANQETASVWRFEYDAVDRLVSAGGREHRGQGAGGSVGRVPSPSFHGNDENALRTYEERYTHDEVGNLKSMRHIAEGGSWTNEYRYSDGSNRLASCGPSDELGDMSPGRLQYDANGNVKAMPHIANLAWDHANRLRAIVGGDVEATYAYDAAGQRARKTVRRGATVEDQLDFGDFEVTWSSTGDGSRIGRQVLHVACDGRRISSVEWTTSAPAADTPATRTRYALCDHLGSVTLEVNPRGAVLGYEEYRPYGTSSYRAVPSAPDLTRKRFRYVGKELDEESGLYYFGARYYAPWLGRWMSCDPIGLRDGPNPYAYVGGNPLRFVDRSGLSRSDREDESIGAGMTSSESPSSEEPQPSVATSEPPPTRGAEAKETTDAHAAKTDDKPAMAAATSGSDGWYSGLKVSADVGAAVWDPISGAHVGAMAEWSRAGVMDKHGSHLIVDKKESREVLGLGVGGGISLSWVSYKIDSSAIDKGPRLSEQSDFRSPVGKGKGKIGSDESFALDGKVAGISIKVKWGPSTREVGIGVSKGGLVAIATKGKAETTTTTAPPMPTQPRPDPRGWPEVRHR